MYRKVSIKIQLKKKNKKQSPKKSPVKKPPGQFEGRKNIGAAKIVIIKSNKKRKRKCLDNNDSLNS